MLAEFYKEMKADILAAGLKNPVRLPGDCYTALPDGHERWPDQKSHVSALSLTGCLAWCEKEKEGTDDELHYFASRKRVRIQWHNPISRRAHSCEFVLNLSKEFKTLQAMEKDGTFTHPQIIQLLKVEFRSSKLSSLIAQLTRVKFNANQTAESELTRTKASVGKSMVSEVCGLDSLPEYPVLTVPVWENFKFEAKVEMALDPDVQMQRFKFVPVPGTLENALFLGEEALLGNLKSIFPDDVRWVHGDPS